MPQDGTQRLVLSSPPKPVNEMTEAELDAWVDQLYDGLAAQHGGAPSAPSPT